MKIHPNVEFNEMLNNGTARIIDYKHITYGNIPTHKIRFKSEHAEYDTSNYRDDLNSNVLENLRNIHLNAELEAAAVTAHGNITHLQSQPQHAGIVMDIKPEAEPVISVEELVDIPSAGTVELAPTMSVPSAAVVELTPMMPVPSAAAVELTPMMPVPSAAAVGLPPTVAVPSAAAVELTPTMPVPSVATVELTPTMPVPSTAAVELAPTMPVPSAAAVELAPTMPVPIAVAVELTPMMPVPSAVTVEPTPTVAVPSAAAVELAPKVAVPSAAATEVQPTESVPCANTALLQKEDAPDCLVMEIHLAVDPSGMILGTQPTQAIGHTVIEMSEPAADEPAEGTGAVLGASSVPPFINFITFNRLGLTVKNLTRLLDSNEDFELNIIDCNSKDNSWDYILSLTDSRIKSKIRFDKNCGPIYAVNFALSRRKPNQYFFTLDSDTYIKTTDWIARFMEVFEAFPDVGVLGLMRDNPYPRYLPPIIPRVNGNAMYLELKNADIETQMDFIPGHLQCLSPALINEIGYWSEENGFGDAELSPRVVHYTNFKVGFLTTIEIDMTQRITCNECLGKDYCTLARSVVDCFSLSKKYNKNESFVAKNMWKFKQAFKELEEGQRTAYCASIHDPESMRTHQYHTEWAYDNFSYYIINGN